MDRLPASRRARAAWCFFDWANSAFPTVIITFVFSVYFVGAIAEDKISGTAQWGYAISFSGIAIALLSPVLGSVADRAGRRKPWLAACSALTIVCSVLLWFAYPDPGYALFALVVLAIANVGFEVGQVFYNAMLPGLVPRDGIGRLSGWGWGLGYAGGLCSLVVLLVFFIQADPPPFGLSPEAHEHIRVIGPFVALWFALFCIPLFALVPDAPSRRSSARQAVREGLATLVSTIRSVRRYRDIAWFLCARLFYVDGMNTMFAFGAVYASQTFGMSTEEVIRFAIVMNVAAGLGAAAFGWVDDLLGSKRTITLALLGLIGVRRSAPDRRDEALVLDHRRSDGPVHGTGPSGEQILHGASGPARVPQRDVRVVRVLGPGDGLCRPVRSRHGDPDRRIPARRNGDHRRLSCGRPSRSSF